MKNKVIRHCLLATAIAIGTSSVAGAQTLDDTAITAQPLSNALKVFADNSGLQVIYLTDIAAGIVTEGAAAGLSDIETLDQLLANTGLKYEFINERTVAIKAISENTGEDIAVGKFQPTSNEVFVARSETSAEKSRTTMPVNDLESDRIGYPIEELVVTAQKREQSIQDVPISIAALSGADLERQKLDNAKDIVTMVPNLQVYLPFGDGGAPIFTLRGITASDYSQNQGRPVAMYVDETYRSSGTFEAVQLYDLKRVEVLRGPQGTLYGKNATGGAINLITNKAGFEREGYLTLGAGNFGRLEAKGAAQSGLIDDVLAARVAFTYVNTDGLVENKFPGASDQAETDLYGVRINLLYTPTDDLAANLRLYKSRSKGENSGILAGNVDASITGVDRTGLDFHTNNANFQAEKRIENSGVALTLNWDVNDAYRLTSITAYDEGKWLSPEDDDGMQISLNENEFSAPDAEQISQELRITSDLSGPFNWIGGLYWGRDKVDLRNIFRFFNDPSLGLDFGLGGLGFNQSNSLSQTRESMAAYLHTTYDITDVLTLTLGARYTEDDTKVEDYTAAIGATPVGSAPGFGIPTITNTPDIDFTDTNFGFKVGLDWQVSENTLLYGSFSQGYRAGAINAQAYYSPASITTVEPEELDAFEIGVKTQLFNNRLMINGAIFYYDYTNQQFLDVVGAVEVLRNAEKSEVLGVDLDATINLSEKLALRAGLGYLDPEYEKLALAGIDFSGNQMIGAPRFNFNAAVDWRVSETSWGAISVHLDTNYISETFHDAPNNPALAQESYWLANGRISLDSNDDRYSIALWAKNMFDKEYITFGFDTAGYGLGFDLLSRGAPRTFGAELTYRF